MPGYQISVSKSRGCLLPLLMVVVTITGLASLVSVLFWKLHYDGGFAWSSDPGKQFAWHPLLLTSSILLMGFGSIMYRITPRCLSRKKSKALHALVMLLALAAAIVGLWAVFDSHNLADPPIPNMFSLHSWVGISTMGFFAIQLLLGLLIFLFPCAPSRIRGYYHPLHVFFGLAMLASATAAALIGITEEALFSLPSSYPSLPGKGVLLNCLGMFLSSFTITVLFIATKSSFKQLD